MISAIVSTIGGPILSVISGCLGESGVYRLWPWNLVSTQVNLLGSDVPQASYGTPGQGFTNHSGSFMPSIVQKPRPKTRIL